jgi:predicted NBD/HSP70 family sugar kinase
MYLGVDVGGTKTLVAVFDGAGEIKASDKFPTPQNYDAFLEQLADTVVSLSTEEFKGACVALPGMIDESGRVAKAFGNLPWLNVKILADCKQLFHCPVVIENDAKLAGLSEANNLKKVYKRVLYITISTGIGYSYVVNGVIEQSIADGGGKTMLVEHQGKLVPWESFASGRAITERYGKRASEIDEASIWKIMAKDFSIGILNLTAIMQPEVIVIGGGVGTHFTKFENPLKEYMKSYETPLMKIPPIRRAKHPEEAVIYGCYDLLKEIYGKRAVKR